MNSLSNLTWILVFNNRVIEWNSVSLQKNIFLQKYVVGRRQYFVQRSEVM